MRTFEVFGESFLDGFTMAGFLHRLRHPGASTRMFAEPQPREGYEVGILPEERTELSEVRSISELEVKSISDEELRETLTRLKREEEDRKIARAGFGGAAHGASR